MTAWQELGRSTRPGSGRHPAAGRPAAPQPALQPERLRRDDLVVDAKFDEPEDTEGTAKPVEIGVDAVAEGVLEIGVVADEVGAVGHRKLSRWTVNANGFLPPVLNFRERIGNFRETSGRAFA